MVVTAAKKQTNNQNGRILTEQCWVWGMKKKKYDKGEGEGGSIDTSASTAGVVQGMV